MDPSSIMSALIGAGPFGLTSALLLFLYLREDKRNEVLTEKLLELTGSMTATLKDITTAVNAALQARMRS